MATLPNGGSKKWDLDSWAVNYVKEAKKRGLTCGVKAETVKVDDALEKGSSSCGINPSSIKYCGDKRVCEWFDAKFVFNEDGSVMAKSDKKFVQVEAKRRGLSCRLDSDNKPCTASNPEECGDAILCEAATYFNHESTKMWHYAFGNKPLIKEAKKRKLSCGVSALTIKELIVKDVQTELNRLGCSAGPEDGIAGQKTMAAARLFSKAFDEKYYPNIIYQDSFYERLKKSWKF